MIDKSKDAPGFQDGADVPPPAVLVANNISMKFPAFWLDAAEVWFTQADTQFSINSFTVLNTKLDPSVAVLHQEVAPQILNPSRAPPARTPYKVLKESFIILYSLNNYNGFEALVSLPLTRSQKPSHLMYLMFAG